jgi:hypothetical protein
MTEQLLHAIRDSLLDDGWKTPDTYTNDFEEIPASSAVYLFLAYRRGYDLREAFVAYVGMSKNAAARVAQHPIFSMVADDGFWPQRWFKPVAAGQLRNAERRYIIQFDQPYNIIGRQRGVDMTLRSGTTLA